MWNLRNFPGARALLLAVLVAQPGSICAANSTSQSYPCPRPSPGAAIQEPKDLRSSDGVLRVDLTVRNQQERDGTIRFCYLLADGSQSPTLRLKPGDLLVLNLKNSLVNYSSAPLAAHADHRPRDRSDPCTSGTMALTATNLHFHGLTLAPICHQDEVLKTSIQPGDPAFQYRFRVPWNQPPGMYWYHPHIHGFSKAQVLGGASGALIIEGIERSTAEVAGLPERVMIIRDQDLLNPDASPSKSEPVVPRTLIDRDGDSANNGTGFGKPAKDLSVNYIPVPYPDYTPPVLLMKPGERQLWRVLNASAITYLNLALIAHGPQMLGVVALDGVPLAANGGRSNAVEWRDHIGLPPGARAEFIVTGPPLGTKSLFVTRTVDTGQGGENDPNRALISIAADPQAAAPNSTLVGLSSPPTERSAAQTAPPWLGDVAAARTRKLFFSERLQDPANPNSATEFYITVDGETPIAFDPTSQMPNITVQQGDVEDWIIENRSTELHAFHIHQIHFLVMDWSGVAVNEPFLRDTVNVPSYTDRMLQYPSVRLRMDFRDPSIVGTFVYHCHLLEHEDGGMMGLVRVTQASHQ